MAQQRVFERQVVARTAPPAARAGFLAQQKRLQAQPGTPLDDTASKQIKPAPDAPRRVVKVIPRTEEAAATKRLPAAPTAPAAAPASDTHKAPSAANTPPAAESPATSVPEDAQSAQEKKAKKRAKRAAERDQSATPET